MTDLPEWVKALQLEGRVRYDEFSSTIRLKGSNSFCHKGASDLATVLDQAAPPGYRISKVSGAVEHERGHRFTWTVIWLNAEEAERRYQDKQAARLSRFNHEETAT